MATTKKTCQIPNCTRTAATLCFCCNQNVCTRHFHEHIEAIKAQIDPLANEVNGMVEKIQALDIERFKEHSLTKIRQWHADMQRLLDEIFQMKCKEIEDLCIKNSETFHGFQKERLSTVMHIQDEVRELVEKEDATKEQIESLEKQLESLGKDVVAFEKDFLVVDVSAVDANLVRISCNWKNSASNQGRQQRKVTPRNPGFSPWINLSVHQPDNGAVGSVGAQQQTRSSIFASPFTPPSVNAENNVGTPHGFGFFGAAPASTSPFAFGAAANPVSNVFGGFGSVPLPATSRQPANTPAGGFSFGSLTPKK